MKILSRTLTERTAEIVTEIEKRIALPVDYRPIGGRPNNTYGAAGTVNPYGENGVYPIWLDKSLPPEAFEADVLHELRHILQVEAGFPSVFNKDSEEFHSKDQNFIQEVGSRLASVVLDIEVNRWLAQMGYSSAFFAKGNLRYLIDNAGFKYPNLQDPLNFANVVLALLVTACDIDEDDAAQLYEAYGDAYPEVVAITKELREALLAMPLDNPLSATLGHGLLVNSLNLWRYYYVGFGGRKIRSRNEYLAFCAEAGFSQDR